MRTATTAVEARIISPAVNDSNPSLHTAGGLILGNPEQQQTRKHSSKCAPELSADGFVRAQALIASCGSWTALATAVPAEAKSTCSAVDDQHLDQSTADRLTPGTQGLQYSGQSVHSYDVAGAHLTEHAPEQAVLPDSTLHAAAGARITPPVVNDLSLNLHTASGLVLGNQGQQQTCDHSLARTPEGHAACSYEDAVARLTATTNSLSERMGLSDPAATVEEAALTSRLAALPRQLVEPIRKMTSRMAHRLGGSPERVNLEAADLNGIAIKRNACGDAAEQIAANHALSKSATGDHVAASRAAVAESAIAGPAAADGTATECSAACRVAAGSAAVGNAAADRAAVAESAVVDSAAADSVAAECFAARRVAAGSAAVGHAAADRAAVAESAIAGLAAVDSVAAGCSAVSRVAAGSAAIGNAAADRAVVQIGSCATARRAVVQIGSKAVRHMALWHMAP